MTQHIVPSTVVRVSNWAKRGPEGSVALDTDYDAWVLRVYSKHQGHPTNFSLSFRNAILGTRKVFQGPIVHEDYAFMVALPTVIALHHGPAPVVVEAEIGDTVEFAGHIWEIVPGAPLHDPDLKLVS